MKRHTIAAGTALFAVAWWLVWRYGTSDWFETRSFAYQVLTAAFLILWWCIPVGACVEVVGAAFSQRVRDSITSHKLVHVMWFVLAGAIAFTLLAPIIYAAKTKW